MLYELYDLKMKQIMFKEDCGENWILCNLKAVFTVFFKISHHHWCDATCNIITGAPVETWIYVPNSILSDSHGLQRIRESTFLQVSSRSWFQLSGTGAEKSSPRTQKTDLHANSLKWGNPWTIFLCVFFDYDSFPVCW